MEEKNKRYCLSDLFLACMCKRFIDIPGTKILMLVGKELDSRIKRRVDDKDVPIICNFLSKNPKVVAVNLAYNCITSRGMENIVAFLKENKSLLELNLMNNDIKEDGIVKLALLKNMMGLRSLRLNGNKIGPKGLKSLAQMLMLDQYLTNLDIGETDQTFESFVYFTTILRTNVTLQSVNLSRVLGPPGHILQTDQIAQLLQQMLLFNKTLRELHLQKIGFMDHDIEILVESLKENSSILLLDLSCNNIGDFGIECLAEYLDSKPPLKTLLVSNNNIGDTGARSLSFKFPYSRIIFLDISENKLTDEGLLDILNCLRKKHPIQGLFIRGNKIGGRTCKVLYRMILSEVLFDKMLDVNVYLAEESFQFSCTEAQDHLKPHYYCLCANTSHKHCQTCTIMEIRNKY